MKKLNFVLKNDNLEIINTDCEYYSDENQLSFLYENLKLIIKKENDVVTFIRESADDSFEISDNKKNIKCIVKIKNSDIKVSLKVDKFTYQMNENKVIINYIIESDEGHEKTIILSL